jgi:hypothetical protein
MNLCSDDKKATKKNRIINASCATINPAIKAHAVREEEEILPNSTSEQQQTIAI